MKECMVRLIYCEMLGYEASFGYIHAIKLAQQGNLLEKRVGYLAVSLFLHENHDLLLLLVNTVLKDLQSTNLVEVCMALTVVCQIFPREMIPAVLPLIEDKLQHSKEIIRAKAVLALYKFYLIAPNQVQHIHDWFRKALCDRDVGVMAASLHIYLQLVKDNPSCYKELTGSFVMILKQVVGGKLPVDFNYHSVPAPWLQIQLLRILRFLGKDDPRTSELIYDVLDESLRRAEINHNITYAILFECVQTIYTIYPKSDLFEKAATCIGKFVLSPKINLKYLGLKALTYVIQQDPSLALQHQMTIIECLDHPDLIIKKETLELLYRITNGQNVTAIVQKMLDYLRQSKEEYTIINLTGKIAELAEKYSPSNEWFIQTMNVIFSVGGDMMHPYIPNNFLRLLAEGFDDEKEAQQLRLYAVQSYLTLLEKNAHYPQRFLQVISWVLGEYSYLKTDVHPESIMAKLSTYLELNSVTSETKAWLLGAVTKLAALTPSADIVDKLTEKFSSSFDTCLRQCAFELQILHKNPEVMKKLLPVNASCEDLVADASLSFLDGFVAEALGCGAAPYKPRHQRQEEKLSQEKALSFEPYGPSFSSSLPPSIVTGRHSPSDLSLRSEFSGNSTEPGLKEKNRLKIEGVKKVWGKEGYLLKKESKTGNVAQVTNPLEDAAEPSNPPANEPTVAISEGEREKQQLASTLFIGLGSSGAISLMGKSERSAQKFKKSSKSHKMKNGKASPVLNIASLSSRPDLAEHSNLEQRCHPFEQPVLRTSSMHTPEYLDSRVPLERAKSLNEVDLGAKLSSLFSSNSLNIFHPLQMQENSKNHSRPSLPLDLAEEPHSDIQELAESDVLRVYSCKVWKEDSLLLLLFIANKSSSALNTVSLMFVDSDAFKLSESFVRHSPVITAQSMESWLGWVEMEKPCNQGMLSGHVHYHLEADVPMQLEFSVTLVLSDFIRPLKITTEDFGKCWLSFSNDVKQNIKLPNTQESLTVIINTLQQKLRLHVVDIIGEEGIIACQLLPSLPALLHSRLHKGMLALWFRSPCSALPDCLLYHCQKEMEGS
nr:AP-4 complex subunit epsilon-1 isoform X2 [Geotrypetes seraphini]XP_033776244.1 AP-4 complex subunit epsilon-1 isoform X2 [Geotrypetes seraphini]